MNLEKMSEQDIMQYLSSNPTLSEEQVLYLFSRDINIPRDIFFKNNLYRNKKLLDVAIDNNLDIINVFENSLFNEETIKKLEASKFIPTKLDFNKYPNMKISNKLLMRAFQKDPNMIVNFDQTLITKEVCDDALKRGFVLKQSDIRLNNYLSSYAPMMEVAINNDPSMIKYLNRDCHVRPEMVYDAIAKMNITYDYLDQNPSVCKNHEVMEVISNINPDLAIFKTDLSDDEKKEYIVSSLQQNGLDGIDKLPFLETRFNFDKDMDDIHNFIDLIRQSVDSDTFDHDKKRMLSKRYYAILDQVIDGLVDNRYLQKKNDLNSADIKYKDIASLNIHIKDVISHANSTADIEKEANRLEEYLRTPKLNAYYYMLDLYYDYKNKGEFSREKSTKFYNAVLNEEENSFKSDTKKAYTEVIKSGLRLTKVKNKQIIDRVRYHNVIDALKEGNPDKLGINSADIIRRTISVKDKVNHSKMFKYHNIKLTNADYSRLESAFLRGNLTAELVKEVCHTDDKFVINHLINDYNQVIKYYLDTIPPVGKENFIDINQKVDIPFNPNNFIFNDLTRYYKAIADVIVDTDEKTFKRINSNGIDSFEMVSLLPLTDLHPEFTTDNVVAILANYKRIKRNLGNKDPFIHFSDVYRYSKGYASTNDLNNAILGNHVINKIHNYNASKYLDTYLDMMKKNNAYIPSLKGEYHDYNYELGNYHDVDRLLIGAQFGYSCIDLLNPAGQETYVECLCQPSADVLTFKDNNGQFIGRSLVFRRGNSVILGHIRTLGEDYTKDLYQEELFTTIASNILKQSKEKKDNIENVFLDTSFAPSLNYQVIRDGRFNAELPHADFNEKVYMLNGNKDDIDFNKEHNVTYSGLQQPIIEDATSIELSRLKALSIMEEEDLHKQEELKRDYQPLLSRNYEKAILGDGWYHLVKEDGETEDLILPSASLESRQEYEEVRKSEVYEKIR